MSPVATRGVLLCGHGSRDVDALNQFEAMAHLVRDHLAPLPVAHGFLEFATPIINHALDGLCAHGVTQIDALPCLLLAAGHAKNDMPSVLNTYAVQHPGVEIRYGRDLGLDPKMIRAAGQRITQALDDKVPPYETALLFVGRGASDPDANSEICKIMRLVWEGLGLGWAQVAYSGVTFPLVSPSLATLVRQGYKRIVVFPYFLFTGVLVKRIYAQADEIARKHPEVEIIKAPYLNTHPLVIDTLLQRYREIDEGLAVMNCQLCKYREQALGFEDEVGQVQHSHHHHVEGIGTGEDTKNGASARESHTHHHDHRDHHHHPYPYADHPMGPVTLDKTKD
ncbi:MAG: sirohydrochlorin chelatase [Pseudomonadota bacterium]